MKSPITGKDMKVMQKEDSLIFRKERFTIVYHYYLCEDSGEEFTSAAMDALNVNQAYNQYRTQFNLPFPDEIIAIREQYRVSAAKMAEILGFGANVYRQYEGGEVPSISNARLIQLAKDPSEFKKLVKASNALDGNILNAVNDRIEALVKDRNDFGAYCLPKYLMGGLHNGKASLYTGYKTPNLECLLQMLVYFTEELKPWKTKLNKLLFYADFLHYKNTGYSISGAEYVAIQMGPVPLNFGSIFEYAAERDYVDITYQEFPNGGVGEYFSANASHTFNTSLFDTSELNTLQIIAEKFRKMSTAEVISISHEEQAWASNIGGKSKISYDYAFKLIHA